MAHAMDPTDQMLREACIRMAARFRWADDYEAVMRDSVRSRLVRLAAKHPSAAGLAQACALREPTRRPPSPPHCGPTLLDRKRAASGERDDD